MILFSKAYGTSSPGVLARAAATSFCFNFNRSIKQLLLQTQPNPTWLQVLLLSQLGQTFSHFRTGPKSADFDQGHRPPGKLRDFFDRTILDFQQGDDQARRWRKLGEDAPNQFTS